MEQKNKYYWDLNRNGRILTPKEKQSMNYGKMTNQGAKGRQTSQYVENTVNDSKNIISVPQEAYYELLSENRRLRNHLQYLKGVMKQALELIEK